MQEMLISDLYLIKLIYLQTYTVVKRSKTIKKLIFNHASKATEKNSVKKRPIPHLFLKYLQTAMLTQPSHRPE